MLLWSFSFGSLYNTSLLADITYKLHTKYFKNVEGNREKVEIEGGLTLEKMEPY